MTSAFFFLKVTQLKRRFNNSEVVRIMENDLVGHRTRKNSSGAPCKQGFT